MTRGRLLLAGFISVSVAAAAFFVGSEIFSLGARAGASEIVILRGQGETVPVIGGGSSIITVVERTEDAKAVVGASTRALLVTEAALQDTDAAWVREQMQRGLVLGGISLTTTDLSAAFDVSKPVTHPNGEVTASPGEETDFDSAGQPFAERSHALHSCGAWKARKDHRLENHARPTVGCG